MEMRSLNILADDERELSILVQLPCIRQFHHEFSQNYVLCNFLDEFKNKEQKKKMFITLCPNSKIVVLI